MARISPLPLKGTRDWLPRDLVRRDRVFALLRGTFERYGFEPLETPAIESTTVLEGKYGEEGERLLFRVLKRGRDVESGFRAVESAGDDRSAGSLTRALSDEALRYDLTVPFARVIAAHQNDLVFPFRRFQMQTVWRGDRPQRGRYREFFQCDVDCVGSRSMTVDAEMALIYRDVFDGLGLTDSITKINHRGLLGNIMEACQVPPESRIATLTAIDKLDKIRPRRRPRRTRQSRPFAAPVIDRIVEIIGISGEPAAVIERLRPLIATTDDGEANLREIADVFIYATEMGMAPERYSFDLSLVRGLGYYTGTIYETVLPGSTLGSLGGGGRYDRLIGMFLGRNLPCVGISFGIERIFDALDERHLLTDEAATFIQALVPLFAPETYAAAFALANDLRQAGIRTELYPDAKELRAQLTFANKKGIPLVALIGPDEIAANAVVLRDLRTGTQRAVPRAEAAAEARAILTP